MDRRDARAQPVRRLPQLGLPSGEIADCLAALRSSADLNAPGCAIGVADGVVRSGECLETDPPPFDAAIAAVDYAFPGTVWCAASNSTAGLDLAGAFAGLLGTLAQRQPRLAADARGSGAAVGVPPAERGFNQAWEIGRRVARRIGCPADAHLVLRPPRPAHQGAAPARRVANVRGAFAKSNPAPGRMQADGRRRRRRDDDRRHAATGWPRSSSVPARARCRSGSSRARTDAVRPAGRVQHRPPGDPALQHRQRHPARRQHGLRLHLVEPLGFSMEDRLLRRAGARLSRDRRVRRRTRSWDEFLLSYPACCTHQLRVHDRRAALVRRVDWQRGDWLVFGSETAGLLSRPTCRRSFDELGSSCACRCGPSSAA